MIRNLTLAAGLTLAGVASAQAATMTTTYSGTLVYAFAYSTDWTSFTGIASGTAFTATFVYDTDAGHSYDYGTGSYVQGGTSLGIDSPILSATLTIGTLTYSIDASSFGQVQKDQQTLDLSQAYGADAALYAEAYTAAPTLGSSLTDSFSSDAAGEMYFYGYAPGYTYAYGYVTHVATGPVETSAVPLPASVVLLLGGVGAIGGLRRLRRAA